MAFTHGKNTRVYIGRYSISDRFREASTTASIETGDTTAYGDDTKEFILGHEEGSLSLGGLFDGTDDSIDDVAKAMTTRTTPMPVVICFAPSSTDAQLGDIVDVAGAIETNYTRSSPVADVASVSIDAQASGGVHTGNALTDWYTTTSAAGTTEHTSVDLTAVASANTGYVATLHVMANTATDTTTVKVQHSANNTTWADLATFAVVGSSTTAEEFINNNSAVVNRYVRAHLVRVGTGDTSTFVAFARK